MNELPETLDMLAFRYIAEEMGVAERERFELQLATDQAAREAVSRMVECSVALRAAAGTGFGDQSVVSLPPRKNRLSKQVGAVAAIGSSLALLLAVAVSIPLFDAQERGPDSSFAAGDGQATELAVAWAETRSQVRSAHELSGDDEWTAETPEALSDLDEAAEETHFQAPSWMLAAVAGLTDDGALPREVVE